MLPSTKTVGENYGNCHICQDTPKDAASALPCGHQFCLGCVLRWTHTNLSCPVCRSPIESIRFSERDEQDYLLFAVISPEESAENNSHAGAAPILPGENSLHGPLVSPAPSPQGALSPAEPGAAGPKPVGGLLPNVWAGLFQQQQHLLDPVRPWLRERLEEIFWDQWWLAQVAQSSILHDLCLHGLNVESLVLRLQNCLGEHTAPLLRGLVNAIVGQCGEEAQRLLLFHTGRETDSASSSSVSRSSRPSISPERISATFPAGFPMEEEAVTSQAALQGGHSCPQPIPDPAEQDQPQEEPDQAVLAAPCAQGGIHSRCAPGQGRDSSGRDPRCAQKRRATSPLDSPPPSKRPRKAPVRPCSSEGLSSEEVMKPGPSEPTTTLANSLAFPALASIQCLVQSRPGHSSSARGPSSPSH